MTYSGSLWELVANLDSTFGFLPLLGEAHKSLLKSYKKKKTQKTKCSSFERTERKREEFRRKSITVSSFISVPKLHTVFTKHTLHCEEALSSLHVWPSENTYPLGWIITCSQLSTTSFQRSWASQVWNSSTTTSYLTYFGGVG